MKMMTSLLSPITNLTFADALQWFFFSLSDRIHSFLFERRAEGEILVLKLWFFSSFFVWFLFCRFGIGRKVLCICNNWIWWFSGTGILLLIVGESEFVLFCVQLGCLEVGGKKAKKKFSSVPNLLLFLQLLGKEDILLFLYFASELLSTILWFYFTFPDLSQNSWESILIVFQFMVSHFQILACLEREKKLILK